MRAQTDTRFYWGEDSSGTTRYDYANAATSATGCPDGYPCTAPVGSFKTNKFGLYDMSGNVWEMVNTDGPATVVHGGSWSSTLQIIRPANHSIVDAGTRNTGLGFRVARELGGR